MGFCVSERNISSLLESILPEYDEYLAIYVAVSTSDELG
jgi:hypothetical protein